VAQLVVQSSFFPHPSSTEAAQVAAVAHVSAVQPHTPDSQGPRPQSAFVEHFRPGAHFGHRVPPQSTSDSVPFSFESVHAGAA
jgi:hypothetical protein